jgi:mono/diheme cytochrome c family protein
MAALAHAEATSPTVRGYAVLKSFMCQPPPPPPAGVSVTLPEIGEGVSTRERLEAHFSDPVCASCHTAMDGIGFSFESLDWLGRYRSEEYGEPIDDSATFTLGGEEVSVTGVSEMAAVLSQSAEVASCVASQWASYGAGMPHQEEADCMVGDLATKLQAEGGLRAMIVAFVTSDWYRRGPGATP